MKKEQRTNKYFEVRKSKNKFYLGINRIKSFICTKPILLFIFNVLVLIIVIIITGNIVALFITRGASNVVGQNKDWITFYGALIGGLFTLLGVKFTIDYSKMLRFEDRKAQIFIECSKGVKTDSYKINIVTTDLESVPIKDDSILDGFMYISKMFSLDIVDMGGIRLKKMLIPIYDNKLIKIETYYLKSSKCTGLNIVLFTDRKFANTPSIELYFIDVENRCYSIFINFDFYKHTFSRESLRLTNATEWYNNLMKIEKSTLLIHHKKEK